MPHERLLEFWKETKRCDRFSQSSTLLCDLHLSQYLLKTSLETVISLFIPTYELLKCFSYLCSFPQLPLSFLPYFFPFLPLYCSVTELCPTLQPHGLQHTSLPCPTPSPGACSNSHTLSWWCSPTMSSCVVPFSSYLQFFPASGTFLMSWLFASDGQSTGA